MTRSQILLSIDYTRRSLQLEETDFSELVTFWENRTGMHLREEAIQNAISHKYSEGD